MQKEVSRKNALENVHGGLYAILYEMQIQVLKLRFSETSFVVVFV